MLMFVESTTIETKKEFNRYKKKTERTKDGSGFVILDTPSNPRKYDAIASIEYGGTLICGLMDIEQAYQIPVRPEFRNPILAKVKELTERDKLERGDAEDYVHLGPGRRA